MKNIYSCLFLFFFCNISYSQNESRNNFSLPSGKPLIDSTAIAKWSSLGWSCAISANGMYVLYTIDNDPVGSNTLVIESTDKGWRTQYSGVEDGKAFFSTDSKYAIFFKLDSVFILDLQSKDIKIISEVRSYKVPFVKGTWLAYKSKKHNALVLCNLVDKSEYTYNKVTDFVFDDSGRVLLLSIDNTLDSSFNRSMIWVDLTAHDSKIIWSTKDYNKKPESFCFDRSCTQLTFTVSNNLCSEIWYYNKEMISAVLKVDNNTEGIDTGLVVKGASKFSYNGMWIFFEVINKVKQFPKSTSDGVLVDIWSYRDIVLQPEQQRKLRADEEATFTSVINIFGNKVVRIENEDEELMTGAELVTGTNVVIKDHKSVQEYWWRLDSQPCYYVINLENGRRKKLLKEGDLLRYLNFSPEGNYLTFWDMNRGKYCAYNIKKEIFFNLNGKIPNRISKDYVNQIALNPVAPIIGWYKNESFVLLYDNYDIWKVDPLGKISPVNITAGYGKKSNVKLRLVNEDNNLVFEGNESLLLSGFNTKNMFNGFFEVSLQKPMAPRLLYMGPYTFYRSESQKPHFYSYDNGMKPVRAKGANVWIVKRQTSTEAPNYFITSDFKAFTQLSNLQPQKDYNWITSTLVTWRMFNGEMSKGILYRPENFDSTKKYPIIFNYYEAMSHLMYEFPEAGYSGGNINIPWFVSRGYLVFNPDIHFKPAKSSNKTVGEWAFNSVVSAAKYLARYSFIDSTKMAIQGHSFGGLETSYIVTHTNMFAAAAEAAGSTDPISAYLTLVPLVSSIEHFTKQAAIETGHELYESTPWERRDLWLRNSAVLNADKVVTPLLIMHCMKDNQVQWRQGVELFMALRRLHKKVWMLQYDNGNHGVFGRDAIDYTKRLTQFFDHYLKDSAPPMWMTKGIPAKLKGIDNGFKYDVK